MGISEDESCHLALDLDAFLLIVKRRAGVVGDDWRNHECESCAGRCRGGCYPSVDAH
jgi:hypothetical protein